jgi:hypothetical protein
MRLFETAQEQAKRPITASYAQRMHFDPDQWRKRFRNLLTSEKIIDFGRPLTLWMPFK